MGCFAKGCLIFLAFAFVLVVAFIAGTYYAWQKVLPTTGIEMPRPAFTEEQVRSVQQRWNEFTRAGDARLAARIELTADEINALINAENPDWKGRVNVAVDGEAGRVRVSIPMDESGWLKGHFINAEGTVQPAVTKDACDAQVTSIVINGNSVPNDVAKWEILGWSLRDGMAGWCADYNLKTFDIRGGKVILETRAD